MQIILPMRSVIPAAGGVRHILVAEESKLETVTYRHRAICKRHIRASTTDRRR